MTEITDEELIRMQDEAKKRVQELQKRARLTYESVQREPAGSDAPAEIPSGRDGLLPALLLLLLACCEDPLLRAVLGYLL